MIRRDCCPDHKAGWLDRNGFIQIVLLGILLLPQWVSGQSTRFEFSRNLMGSPFRLVFYAQGDSLAKAAAEQVFARIEVLNALLSDYKDGSEINRLSGLSGRGHWVRTSPELFDILARSCAISKQTEGAFEVTVGPMVQLWRRSLLVHEFPSRKAIRKTRKRVGYRLIELDTTHRLVRLKRKGMRLDVGGIGKGYAADEGIRILRGLGIRSAMLDAGGDLAFSGPPPGAAGWKIEITSDTAASPVILSLADCGVATSGAHYRFFTHKGKTYSHIVNPATGIGLRHHVRSTVVARDGTEADALATAIGVMGIRKSKRILTRFPDARVWLLEKRDGNIRDWNTLGHP